MTKEQFKDNYMIPRLVFDMHMINPGDAIKVYEIDPSEESEKPTLLHVGIVEEVDALRIKYTHFSWREQKMLHGYIMASDIPFNPQTNSWSTTPPYKIFEVIPV